MNYKLSAPLKAALWFTLCQFLQKAIVILTMPFITRMLTTSEYGKISTFTAWESIFIVLVTLSSGHAVMNLCVKYEKRDKMLSSLTGYNLTLAFAWGIIILMAQNQIRNVTGMSSAFIAGLYFFCVS